MPPPVRFMELEVPLHMIFIKEPLGGGCLGDEYRGLYNDTLEVAVKTFKFKVRVQRFR